MKKLVRWWCEHVWPWSEIDRLKWNLATANSQISSYINRDSSHHQSWLSAANQMWGPKPFTEGEISILDSMYYRGYGWRNALDYLVIAQRLESRQGIQYDKFEVK